MGEDLPSGNLPERVTPANRPVPTVTGTVRRPERAKRPAESLRIALPTGRQTLIHLSAAFCLGVLVTWLIVNRHQAEREADEPIDPINAFNEAPALYVAAAPDTAVLPAASSESGRVETISAEASNAESSKNEFSQSEPGAPEPNGAESTAFVDVRSPSVEIISPPKNYKEKDRLLVLHKNDKVTERYINFTPDVIDAAIRCNPTRVRELIGQGADVNSADERGDTILAWAVKRKCEPVVQLLLERGAHVNTLSRNGFTPYVWSRIYRYPQLSEILKAAGADTDLGSYWWRHEDDGSGPWMRATYEALCKNQLCD